MKAWILASRPKTLTATIAPILVGVGVVQVLAPTEWLSWPLIFILVATIAIQIATNFFNDALDFEKGADRSDRLGPQRASASGLLSAASVKRAGFFCLGVALAAGIPLVWLGGWPIVAIGILSLGLAYMYTGGPFPLAYRGLGDLFVLIFFGWVAVGGVIYLLLPQYSPYPWVMAALAGTQVGLLGTSLIAINNLRDREQDQQVGKNTLAVRIGDRLARWEIVFCLTAPLALGAFYLLLGSKHWLFLLPVGTVISMKDPVQKVLHGESGVGLNGVLAQSARTQLLFAVLFLGASFF